MTFGPQPPFINERYNGRVRIVNGLSLQIEDIQLEDDGLYECKIVDIKNIAADEGTYTRLTVIGEGK